MKACGIIVEYNPFHNGHKYHVEQARKLSGAEVVVAVMSGNFLQRGEPAVIDKWLRAQEALQNGVDLVVELPVQWSLQSADYFARGGILLLQALQCESYCFGTDAGDHFDYQAFGQFVVDNQNVINDSFQQLSDPTLTYAQKMTEVFRQIYPELVLTGNQPNHILGLSYAQENAHYPTPMRGLPLTRIGAGYHTTELTSTIASATAIRQAVRQEQSIADVVPKQTAYDLNQYCVSWENYWDLLKYRIVTSSIGELQNIYQMVEGLEYRLKAFVHQATNFAEFVQLIKTKRYTQTRIQRLLCYVLLNLTKEEVETAWQTNYLHVLGFTENGQQYLKEQKKNFSLPLVSKIGKVEEEKYPLAIRSDQVYQMGKPQIVEQNFGKFPIRLS
ncbi:nucleotidyltransferase [Enterococcus saccharolyticus]|uniref:nucleotidyltransferase n=1 Tax=Enterococcus TaxID=1350 RepID=UPI001E28D863|nr:nucleotidyltransferase [Enterococcus saccharolyticus]MCD5001002.1 nucleotidyltransferase [Enterococcus saccharolyticus]